MIKVWVSKDKDMIAFYTKEKCIDIFLREEGLPKDKVKIKFFIGEEMLEERVIDTGEIGSLDEFIEFLEGGDE